MKLTNCRSLLEKCGNVLALVAVFMTANIACCWYYHQPEFPKEAKRFRRCKQE